MGRGPFAVGGTALAGRWPPLDRTVVISNAHCLQNPAHPSGYKGIKCAKCLTTAQTSPEMGGVAGGRRRRPRSLLSASQHVSVGTELRRASCWADSPPALPFPLSEPGLSCPRPTLNRTGSSVSSCCPDALPPPHTGCSTRWTAGGLRGRTRRDETQDGLAWEQPVGGWPRVTFRSQHPSSLAGPGLRHR